MSYEEEYDGSRAYEGKGLKLHVEHAKYAKILVKLINFLLISDGSAVLRYST